MLKISGLCFSYSNKTPYILNDINLEIKNGEYLSILGENGSGKSTLLRLLLKFLKPTKGKILLDFAKISYVPQKNDFFNAAFPITVYEVLNSYRKLLHIKDKSIIEKYLTQMGLENLSDQLVGNLSGGQNQKLMIARALLAQPALLILDEPSTGIDIKSQEEIYGLLKGFNTMERMTIISVEHNLNAAIANSTLIYHLMNGNGHLCAPEQYAHEFLNIHKEGR